MKNNCEGNHFFNKVASFTPATVLQKTSITGNFQRYLAEVQKNYISELHTKQFFVAHLVLQNTTQGLRPKPNMK